MDTSQSDRLAAQVLAKPNELLVMIPTAGRLSPLSRKLFNELLFEGGRQFQARLERGEPMLAEETFEARLASLTANLPGAPSSWTTAAKNHFHEMMSTLVEWESVDKTTLTEEWGEMPLLSVSKIIKRGNDLFVQWAFPPEVLVALKDPAFYTKLNLQYVGQLRTYAAISLYEICSRYRTNPSGVTCVQPPDWWVEALSGRSVRVVTGRKLRDAPPQPKREWRKVKSESVLDAIEEINSKTDLTIQLIEKRTGRAVTAVQFGVQRKRMPEDKKASLPADIVQKAVAVGVTLRELASIAKSVHGGIETVRAALSRMEQRSGRDDLVPIENPSAYLRSMVNEMEHYVDHGAAQLTPTTPLPAAVAGAKGTSSQLIQDVEETPQSVARRTVDGLSREAKEELARKAFESMRAKGLATASIAQSFARFLEGGSLGGFLLSEMAQIYASETPRHTNDEGAHDE